MEKLAGRYRVGEALGEGGGSAVVRYGFDTVLKRPVAIKMFDGSAADVLREARTAAGLSHPNIAQVYDYGEILDGDRRTPYLVMEFIGGETLADRIARTGALRWRRVAEICAETADALAAAHAQSLVHRDVHPRNVMLTTEGVKVLDFGIAAVAGPGGVEGGDALWGSPAYLAPEQLRGEPSFPAADVYALGLLMFESLTGSRAWPGETLGAILATRHGRPAPRLPRLAGLPRDLVRLYEASTADDPGERPTAADVGEILRRVGRPAPLTRPAVHLRPGPVSLSLPTLPASPSSAQRRSRRRAAVVGSAAAVAIVLSVVGVQLANGTVTPGGREAEAAVEAPHPAATSARPSAPVSSSPASARVHRTDGTTTVNIRKKNRPTGTPPATSTTTPAPTKPATAPPVKPSSPPATTTSPKPPQPTPTRTPDETPKPTDPTTEPTDPAPTTPPATTPPATAGPGTLEDAQLGESGSGTPAGRGFEV